MHVTGRVEFSAMGVVRPPAGAAIETARRRETQGFDAVWWADHFLHWFPNGIWTPDLVPQASSQPSPHVWFDPVPIIAAAATATQLISLGTGVTDVVRRHPASVAQTALTLDHISNGRFLLGIGTGEALNLEPYGLANTRPMARLEEALAIIRHFISSQEPLDHAGDFFTLRGAQIGLPPLNGTPPPIWMAAHRPRGLALAGRMADGWLPLATEPAQYAQMLAVVREGAQGAGRPERSIQPGLYARIVVAATRERAEEIVDASLLMRFIALTRPAEAFARHGHEHPLGSGAFGLTTFLPNRYSRAEALALAEAVPAAVVRESVILGTPDDIAARIREFIAVGARHIQLTNMTPMASPRDGAASEELLGAVVHELRR